MFSSDILMTCKNTMLKRETGPSRGCERLVIHIWCGGFLTCACTVPPTYSDRVIPVWYWSTWLTLVTGLLNHVAHRGDGGLQRRVGGRLSLSPLCLISYLSTLTCWETDMIVRAQFATMCSCELFCSTLIGPLISGRRVLWSWPLWWL